VPAILKGCQSKGLPFQMAATARDKVRNRVKVRVSVKS